VQQRHATAAVIGAGDFVGGAIAKKFAAAGFNVFAGRRNGDKLAPLAAEIEGAGGRVVARALDARKEDEIAAFVRDADRRAPLEVCIFNVGANVNFPIFDTTERVFRKVWEMACNGGFLVGREAARYMVPRGRGCIAGVDTAWVRDRIREHEGDEAIKNLDPGRLMGPDAVAESYWQLYKQARDAWTFEQEIRPFGEKW